LAICFGPTLVPIPEDRDQVQFQNLVNELIKNFIIFHEDIFPTSVPGSVYEKYLTQEPEDMGDSPEAVDQSHDDEIDSEFTEDDSVFKEDNDKEDDLQDFSLDLFGKPDTLVAQALYDFSARSTREVNFHKGDTIVLFKQVSNDWWKGSVRGQEGLIPDKYIMLKMKGEDDRERLESSKSNEETSITRERLGSLDEGKRSRASSSSDKVPSPSPSVHRKRANSTQTSSSPLSQRASRSSVTSSTRSSTSTKPTSPGQASTTVITVDSGSRRMSKDSIKESPQEEALPSPPGPATNTHIIKVSGPVTNLDETVTSAEQSETMSEAMAPRSRLPLSPSMEARLSTSQDSLSSSGSNRELKTQLDSTLAEVEAIAEQLEKQKKPTKVLTLAERKSDNDILPKPTVRRKTSEQLTSSRTLPSSNGARPRERASLSSITTPPDPAPRPTALSSSDVSTKEPLVNVKQSSWASRDGLNSEQKAFSLNKNMWERRSGSTSGGGSEEVGSLRGGFRSNRDFWNQRVAIQQKQKQTPDLVLDLPASTVSPTLIKPKPRPRGSGKASDSLSSASSSSGDETLATADQFAKPDRNTLRKSSGASSSAKSSPEDHEENSSNPKRIPPVQARLQQKRSTEH